MAVAEEDSDYFIGSGSSNTVSITCPAGCLIVVGLYGQSFTLGNMTCSGSTLGSFTLIDDWAGSGGTDPFLELTMWAKYSSGSLTGETITCTQGSGFDMQIVAGAFSGVGGFTLDSFDHEDGGNPVPFSSVAAATLGVCHIKSGFDLGGAMSGWTNVAALTTSDINLFQWKEFATASGSLSLTNGLSEDFRNNIGIAASFEIGGAADVLAAQIWL